MELTWMEIFYKILFAQLLNKCSQERTTGFYRSSLLRLGVLHARMEVNCKDGKSLKQVGIFWKFTHMQTDQEQHSLWVHKLFGHICNLNIKKKSKASLCESCCFAFYQWSFFSESLAPDAKVSGLCRANRVTQRVPSPHPLIFLHSVIFSVSGKSSSQANISPGQFEFVLVQHKGFLVINIFTTVLRGISLNCFVFSRDQWMH